MNNNKLGNQVAYRLVVDYVTKQVWAIMPEMLEVINQILYNSCFGSPMTVEQIEAKLGTTFNNQYKFKVENGNAVIPVHGVISRRMNLFNKISGGVSSEILKRDIKVALEDPDVKKITLDIDSPGGVADAGFDLSNFIYQNRGVKPIEAYISGTGASAAYLIASATDKVYAMPASVVGSIGVIANHVDFSKANEKVGIKKTYIYAGKYKAIANDAEPLSKEGREYLQSLVDKYYAMFVADVARNRGVDIETVLSDMADGRVFIGRDALNVGLVDEIVNTGDINILWEGVEMNSTGNVISPLAFTHNSETADDEPAWSSVDKTALPRLAFADQGEDGKKSSWRYPHHWVKGGTKKDADGIWVDGTMYLHRGGLSAAWGAAHGARSGQKASPQVISHLQSHRKALGMSANWDAETWFVETKTLWGDQYDTYFKDWMIVKENNKGGKIMNMETLRKEYPELVSAIEAQAREGYVKKEDVESEKLELETKCRELEKRLVLMEEERNGAIAKTIQDRVLAESILPEALHNKVKAMVDYHAFLDNENWQEAFESAFKAEVDDWENSLKDSSFPVGSGTPKQDDSLKATYADENKEIMANL